MGTKVSNMLTIVALAYADEDGDVIKIMKHETDLILTNEQINLIGHGMAYVADVELSAIYYRWPGEREWFTEVYIEQDFDNAKADLSMGYLFEDLFEISVEDEALLRELWDMDPTPVRREFKRDYPLPPLPEQFKGKHEVKGRNRLRDSSLDWYSLIHDTMGIFYREEDDTVYISFAAKVGKDSREMFQLSTAEFSTWVDTHKEEMVPEVFALFQTVIPQLPEYASKARESFKNKKG